MNKNLINYLNEKINDDTDAINKKLKLKDDIQTKLTELEGLLLSCNSIFDVKLKDYVKNKIESEIITYNRKLSEINKLKNKKSELDQLVLFVPKIKN